MFVVKQTRDVRELCDSYSMTYSLISVALGYVSYPFLILHVLVHVNFLEWLYIWKSKLQRKMKINLSYTYFEIIEGIILINQSNVQFYPYTCTYVHPYLQALQIDIWLTYFKPNLIVLLQVIFRLLTAFILGSLQTEGTGKPSKRERTRGWIWMMWSTNLKSNFNPKVSVECRR